MKKSTSQRTRRSCGIITKPQINTIMLICAQFGISKEDRGELLQERYKKSSTADLTSDQAGHFIAEFERKGFVVLAKKGQAKALPPRRKRGVVIPRTGDVIALVSQDERDKVAAVAGLIEWRTVFGLALFLKKRMGLKDGKVRTSAEAYLAIEGLKKMFENGMKAKHGKGWWRMQFDSEAVQDYIKIHCPDKWK
jgi:hypothetical protein